MALATTDLGVLDTRLWRPRAACQGRETDLFFPAGSTGPAADQLVEAKAVCRRCPVAEQCLEYALLTSQEYGVWGGLSEDERRQLRRGSRRPAVRVP